MWTKERIREDLGELRVLPGDSLIVHASLRGIGKVEGGADSVVEALLETVGPEGTIMVPAFRARDGENDSPDPAPLGALAERIALHPDAKLSAHPILSFSAIGRNAEFLTSEAPLHYPLGTNSPLARLYQLNGGILLLGVGHEASSALHLAEVWADAPYARRPASFAGEDGELVEMMGSPECSQGFGKIEPVLRQARILREGYVGNAPSQYMRMQYAVTMAIEMLRGNPESLLCEIPACPHCTLARKFTSEARPLDRRGI
jgi:aminoglycoside 3-N-acetyltransferase